MDNAVESHDAGIARYEGFLKTDPTNTMILVSLGDQYHQAGRLQEATECFQKCLQTDEHHSVAQGRLANLLITQHQFPEAEALFKNIINTDGEDPATLHNLGLCIFYQERFTDALEYFQRARDAGLDHPSNLAYIVYSLHHCEDTESALAVAKSWLETNPGIASEGYVSLLEMDHGDMQSAQQRAESVLQREPENEDANIVMGSWQIEQQQIDKAVKYFERVIRNQPNNARGWQGLGLTYMYNRDLPRAINNLEKAHALIPGNATILIVLGWAYLASENFIQSEIIFRQAMKADHSFGEAHGGLAVSLAMQNKQDEAKTEVKRAMGLDKQGFSAVYANSILLTLQGKQEMGQKMLAKLLDTAPTPDGKPLIEYIQLFLKQQGVKRPAPRTGQPSKA